MKTIDNALRPVIIGKILDGELPSALELLSSEYGVTTPRLRVGTIKGHRGVAACYLQKQKTIVFANSEMLRNPTVVLHEFYHHLVSSIALKGGGTDKDADRFVRRFISVSDREPTDQANEDIARIRSDR